MRAKVLCICAAFLFAAGAARAQQPDQDPMGQSFFAPELVMQHQEAIGLSAEQKEYFKTEIRQAQLKFTELQWKLQDEMEKLVGLARQRRAAGTRATGKGAGCGTGNQKRTSDVARSNQEQIVTRAAGKAV